MAKPLPKQVPSDDCAVTIGGQVYQVHEGEWVTVLQSSPSIRDQQAIMTFQMLGPKVAAAKDDDEAQQELLPELSAALDVVCETLAGRVVAWNWTDDQGKPMPTLDGSPDPFKGLRDEEIAWLMDAVKGETAGAEKKDSVSSRTISSASAPPPIRTPSSTARSRTKAS